MWGIIKPMTLQTLTEITDVIDRELASYPELMRRLLVNRGITTRDNAFAFLNPSYEDHVYDPFLLKDMEKAIDRIHRAIQSNETIAVYADYDSDGVPGAVLMHDFFTRLGFTNFVIYIPDRHKEGYGLQKEALTKLFSEGVSLVVTVDLGITNNTEVDFCNEYKVDCIVTDHHLVGEEVPRAYAVVNPKQETCMYPDEMLCGTGVAFKLVQAFLKKYGEKYGVAPGQEKWMLDMVGLATLSDMVPLVNENRVFAYYGLMVFKKTRRPGLLHLLKKSGVKLQYLIEDDITFMVTPRINAAGRMDHPKHAFELLASQDHAESFEKAVTLENYNTDRKNLVKKIMKQALAKLADRPKTSVIVLGDRTWHVGVLGLVASRLVEEFDVPVFVWGGDEEAENLKGSCRGNGTVNMVELMRSCADCFTNFGGHEEAGGFSVDAIQIHQLAEKLQSSYENLKQEKSQEKVYEYDTELSLSDVGFGTYKEISRLAPFGVGNPKPVFLFRDVLIRQVKVFGKHNEHLEILVMDETGATSKAIAFFTKFDAFGEPLEEGKKIQLFASMEYSTFGYKPETRLRIVTIHI